ncbi:MAG: MBOAT family protein [Opitutales bacterium]|nr:MBOAT family protein [Opitutales bacterium]
MKSPLLSKSLSEFWSERWNRAFNRLANLYFFKPTIRAVGLRSAIVFTFLISGLIHELVISVPARDGYGLPTLYFLIQGAGIVIERGNLVRRPNRLNGWKGHLFTWVILILPLPLLFHKPFLNNVIIPFFNVLIP